MHCIFLRHGQPTLRILAKLRIEPFYIVFIEISASWTRGRGRIHSYQVDPAGPSTTYYADRRYSFHTIGAAISTIGKSASRLHASPSANELGSSICARRTTVHCVRHLCDFRTRCFHRRTSHVWQSQLWNNSGPNSGFHGVLPSVTQS